MAHITTLISAKFTALNEPFYQHCSQQSAFGVSIFVTLADITAKRITEHFCSAFFTAIEQPVIRTHFDNLCSI